jgi:hypothetical protein
VAAVDPRQLSRGGYFRAPFRVRFETQNRGSALNSGKPSLQICDVRGVGGRLSSPLRGLIRARFSGSEIKLASPLDPEFIGSRRRVSAVARGRCERAAEARACFQWSNFVRATASAAGKPILLINFDETSIPMWSKPKKGYLIFGRRGDRKAVLRKGPGQPLSSRRSAVSLLAFLCDDPAIQPLLPQVFVSNERVLLKSHVASLNSECRRNVFFIRRQSSWANAALLVEAIGLLSQCLAGVLQTRRVVLHMDAARAHLHLSVVKACARAGFFLMYIPASTTAWLQPLDTSVFSRYKQWVARELEKIRLTLPSGRPSRLEVMGVCSRGVAAVMEANPWQHAFEATGLSGQGGLSEGLRTRLQWREPPAFSSALPSLADLQAVYPRGAHIPMEELFELPLRCANPVQLVLRRRARLPPAAAPPPLPPPLAG